MNMTKAKIVNEQDIRNPELKELMAELKDNNGNADLQEKVFQALIRGQFLAPMIAQTIKNAKGKAVGPAQLKFVLLNTNKGQSFFPLFTDAEEAHKMNPQSKTGTFAVRTIKDYDAMFKSKNNTADGIVINAMSDNIILNKNLIGLLAMGETPRTMAAKQPGGDGDAQKKLADLLAGRGGNVQVAFSEPQVYPTAMANAVYDLCCTMPEVSRVWLKLASFEMARTYVLVVEHEGSGKEVLGRISEAAAPLSRNMPVGMMEYREELGQTALKDAVPLYDRELEL